MPSTAPFAQMDWDHNISLVKNQDASLDDSSLEPTDPEGASSSIDGHFDPEPQEEQGRRTGGVIHQGEAMFYTENTSVEVGDFLDISYDDNDNTVKRWKIVELVSEHAVVEKLTGVRRRQMRLRLEGQTP